MADRADHLMHPHPSCLMLFAHVCLDAPRVIAKTHKKGKARALRAFKAR
jgi:hypothetical protein